MYFEVAKHDWGLDSGKPHGFSINRLPLKSMSRFLMQKNYQKAVIIFFVFNSKQSILVEFILNLYRV